MYNASDVTRERWVVAPRGRFLQFENREVNWYPGERDELRAFFSGPQLPFPFGYSQGHHLGVGDNGVLMGAWRADNAV